jgi:D-alanine-D-alanine ligase
MMYHTNAENYISHISHVTQVGVETEDPLILVLYNVEEQVLNKNPLELVALQDTARVAMHIISALKTLGYFTIPIAVRNSLSELRKTLAPFSPKTAFVFNNCDGFNGQNKDAAKVIRVVESLGFKHTGSLADAVKICIDKSRMKQKLAAAHLPSPRYQVFTRAQGVYNFSFPAIVKPLTDDASIGIDLHSVVQNYDDLMRRIKYVIEYHHQPALVEEYILGRELTVSLWGNRNVQALPISEQDYALIQNPLHRILTYESKWDPTSFHYQNIPTYCPAPLAPDEAKRVISTAICAYQAIGLRDYARIDMRYREGVPYVIDINEVPDLGPGSGFSVSATAAGYTYIEMIAHLLEVALEREGWKCPQPILKSLPPRLQTASMSSD